MSMRACDRRAAFAMRLPARNRSSLAAISIPGLDSSTPPIGSSPVRFRIRESPMPAAPSSASCASIISSSASPMNGVRNSNAASHRSAPTTTR